MLPVGWAMTTLFRSAVFMFAGLSAPLLASAAAQSATYQVYKDADCAPNAECGINFAKVQDDKTLKLNGFSCYLRIPENTRVGAAQLVLVNSDGSRAFATTAFLQLQDGPRVGADFQRVYVSNDTIDVVAKQGQRFRAYAVAYKSNDGSVATVSQLSCGISGELE